MSNKKKLRRIKKERDEISASFARVAEFVCGLPVGHITFGGVSAEQIIYRFKRLREDLLDQQKFANKYVCKTNRFQQVLGQLSEINMIDSKFPDAFLTPSFGD